MGKAPLILQYLHDHARLVCDRRNAEDGPGTWRITAVPDNLRRNIIFHYGTTEHYEDFFAKNKNNLQRNLESEKEQSPLLNNHEINLKALERREMIRMSEKKVSHQSRSRSRLTLKRNSAPSKGGIFSQGLQANSQLILDKKSSFYCDNDLDKELINNNKQSNDIHGQEQGQDNCVEYSYSHQNPEIDILPNIKRDNNIENNNVHLYPSTSSIYLADISVTSSDDYEIDLFNEPPNFDHSNFQSQSQSYHQTGSGFNNNIDPNHVLRNYYYGNGNNNDNGYHQHCDDWFENTANFTQSQRNPSGFIPSYNKFNSQN